MTNVILAIDPGSVTGWALVDCAGKVTHGTWSFPAVSAGRRLSDLRAHMSATLFHHQRIDLVAYEKPFVHRFANAIIALANYEGVILEWAATAGIECAGFTPKEIKASIAGGAAGKQRMIETVRWLGYAPANDHEADALALLRLAMTGTKPAAPTRRAAAVQQRKLVDDLFCKKRKVQT